MSAKKLSSKRVLLVFLILIFSFVSGGLWAQAALPTVKAPAIQTAPGYAPEIEIVKILAKRTKLDLFSKVDAVPDDLEKNGKKAYETLIIIIGGSGKGLGAAGVSIEEEIQRAKDLLARAKKLGMFIIGIHCGGADRRGPNTEALLPAELPYLNYLIVRSDGDKDGVFAKAAKTYKYPITEVEKTADIQAILKTIFKLP